MADARRRLRRLGHRRSRRSRPSHPRRAPRGLLRGAGVRLPALFRRQLDRNVALLGDNDRRCHVGHDHAPEHIAQHAPALGVPIAGEMVLPRNSTHVSVFDLEPEVDALTLCLASIACLRTLRTETVVLPSHGWRLAACNGASTRSRSTTPSGCPG